MVTSPRRTHPSWYVAGVSLILLAVMTVALMVAGPHTSFAVDTWWQQIMDDIRSPALMSLARGLDTLGTGILGIVVVPLLVIGALLIARRPWGALTFVGAVGGSAVATQVLKHVVGRDRPVSAFVDTDFGSFPSGHVSHAAVMTIVLAVILRRAWMWVVAAVYTTVMMASRTLLGVHWLSDVVAGLLLGLAVALIAWRAGTWLRARREVGRSGQPADVVRTTIFPVFSPRMRPRKASTEFSIPSTTVSSKTT
ncbi:undecaprenyl-diphosphatase [Sanguibacter gelidistatuariae]|uniref:Undecaprenyl-diphosphatase n=1 Tax=Sanguibacter gelidistatuariae TaxID=1814289 RepID=A0A1G6MP90_9MICO|nr:undecaprenyl-diphosphatase [Sanguibacter gelidistatuariae]